MLSNVCVYTLSSHAHVHTHTRLMLYTLFIISHYSRLPALKSFLRDGEAEWYRRVELQYVRGQLTLMHIYEEGNTSRDVINIVELNTAAKYGKDELHRVMINVAGLELKSADERQADVDRKEALRHQRQRAMFHRDEYVRLMELHAQLFRRDIMQDTLHEETSWIHTERDYLYNNYDQIFRHEAITKEDLRWYATRYLLQLEERQREREQQQREQQAQL
jgi:Sep15/SelM redox domain